MFKCPHCNRHGIGFPDKLFTSGGVWFHRTATCRYCRQLARLSGPVVRAQFVLFVISLAVIPWMVPGEYRVTVALMVAGIILAIGVFAPLSRQIL